MSQSEKNLDKQIISLGEKRNLEKLKKLLERTSIKTLLTLLSNKLGRNDCTIFWNYLLQGFNPRNFDACEKRFACVQCFLESLLKIELSYKQTYDLVTRLCLDLPTFPNVQLIEMVEHCVDALRTGDPKCVGWKDLLPEILHALQSHLQLNVNGVSMTGLDYRNNTVRSLYTMRWPIEVLTPVADMFKDMHLNATELSIVLNKFSGYMKSLAPSALPALCYQLFSMCSSASQIIIPILALEKYFHRFYYKKLFADMDSNSTDFDSIDDYSDKELREAEETILHHLHYCTQYKISEVQLCVVLRNFFSMPDVILTPFVLSAILSMSGANRDPDTRTLSASVILPFLRSVIHHNEKERTLADYSVWCRDCLQRKQVNLEQVFTVLIDQNKEGKDVITPGLVNLVFILLKAKSNNTLSSLAIAFLTKFIRKRFVFGQGVIKKVAEWMIVDQELPQYAECLALLSVADTFTVSECVKTIKYVMDFFLWISGEHAMRMMSFILPTLKISPIVRDGFIEMLRKAMISSDVKTRRMAVYGFCMILKQLNNSNAQRSQLGMVGVCTQQSISGFSLMSQATLGNRCNPQRHFDMLTLEIIGLLRNCFNQTLDIKRTLYENLQRAVELNPKLVPHVLQFIDWHFRSYFLASNIEGDDNNFIINFSQIVYGRDAQENEIEVTDNLGSLVLFISYCLSIFEKFGGDYDIREIKRLLHQSVEKVIGRDIKFEGAKGSLTHLRNELFAQQLNFIESLMAYTLLTAKKSTDEVRQLLPLFREHRRLQEIWKSQLSNVKRSQKKKDSNDTTEGIISNTTINGVVVKKIEMKVECIWDLQVLEMFLRLLHEDIVPFALSQHSTALRSNSELVRFVLTVAIQKIEGIRLEPEYKQLSHSRRVFKYLTDITKVIYERCIKRLPELWRVFDVKTAALAAECFRECLVTSNLVYKKRFANDFVKGFDLCTINNCREAPAILHDVISTYMQEDFAPEGTEKNVLSKNADARKIPIALLQSLQVLYDNISYGNRITCESYTWLLNFCKQYEVHSKEMSLVHKLLFMQRQKTHFGAFFNTIAMHLGNVFGFIKDEEEGSQLELPFVLKSITFDSAETCLNYLYGTLRKQIEDVDYFIIKANNMSYKYRIMPEEDCELCLTMLRSLERSICTQLVHISNTLLNLTNVRIPLGLCMDNLFKLLILHFICLKNLAKHFINCCASLKLSIQSTKFDALLHVVGKPLPTNIYSLITYIEANILEDQRKLKTNPQAEKAKVLRETKLIPKTILCVENFNKHVILLSKKTNDRLANFLHIGTVRDFRIKTSDLKAAIERSLSLSSQIESVESTCEQTVEEEAALTRLEAESAQLLAAENEDDEDDVNVATSSFYLLRYKKRNKHIEQNREQEHEQNQRENEGELTTPEDAVLENESNMETHSQVLANLGKINKKAKKRTLDESEQYDQDAKTSSVQQESKKRRGCSTKK